MPRPFDSRGETICAVTMRVAAMGISFVWGGGRGGGGGGGGGGKGVGRRRCDDDVVVVACSAEADARIVVTACIDGFELSLSNVSEDRGVVGFARLDSKCWMRMVSAAIAERSWLFSSSSGVLMLGNALIWKKDDFEMRAVAPRVPRRDDVAG